MLDWAGSAQTLQAASFRAAVLPSFAAGKMIDSDHSVLLATGPAGGNDWLRMRCDVTWLACCAVREAP